MGLDPRVSCMKPLQEIVLESHKAKHTVTMDFDELFDLNGVLIQTQVTKRRNVIDDVLQSFPHPTHSEEVKAIGFDTECHLSDEDNDGTRTFNLAATVMEKPRLSSACGIDELGLRRHGPLSVVFMDWCQYKLATNDLLATLVTLLGENCLLLICLGGVLLINK
ncbi:hypothetical protein GmHk_10G027468 [Glycine max]|nr:hypothetical protein GmHk_10G027468 [Glycine max]